jgi:hypothetical protein
MFYYDPLAVAPFDTLTDKEKEERAIKYGTSGVPQSYIKSNPQLFNNTSTSAPPAKRPQQPVPERLTPYGVGNNPLPEKNIVDDFLFRVPPKQRKQDIMRQDNSGNRASEGNPKGQYQIGERVWTGKQWVEDRWDKDEQQRSADLARQKNKPPIQRDLGKVTFANGGYTDNYALGGFLHAGAKAFGANDSIANGLGMAGGAAEAFFLNPVGGGMDMAKYAGQEFIKNDETQQNMESLTNMAGSITPFLGNPSTSFAYGGKYATGGDVNPNPNMAHFEGPKHEQGGVTFAPGKEAEGGEVKVGNYIFSDRLKPKGFAKTFAQLAKKVENKYKMRSDDSMAQEAMDQELTKLQTQQENHPVKIKEAQEQAMQQQMQQAMMQEQMMGQQQMMPPTQGMPQEMGPQMFNLGGYTDPPGTKVPLSMLTTAAKDLYNFDQDLRNNYNSSVSERIGKPDFEGNFVDAAALGKQMDFLGYNSNPYFGQSSPENKSTQPTIETTQLSYTDPPAFGKPKNSFRPNVNDRSNISPASMVPTSQIDNGLSNRSINLPSENFLERPIRGNTQMKKMDSLPLENKFNERGLAPTRFAEVPQVNETKQKEYDPYSNLGKGYYNRGAAMQSIGPAAQMIGSLVGGPDQTNFDRVRGNFIDPTIAINNAERQGALASASAKKDNKRTTGQTIASNAAVDASIANAMGNTAANIRYQSDAQNAQIGNNVNAQNAQIQMQEKIANEQNRAAYRDSIYGSINDMSNNMSGARGDYASYLDSMYKTKFGFNLANNIGTSYRVNPDGTITYIKPE